MPGRADEHKISRIIPTVVDGDAGRSWLFVEVETNLGLIGVGEASQNRLDEGVVAQLAALAPFYIGRNPLDLIEDRARLLRLSAGEQVCGRTAFREILEQRALDVLMPDVKWIGGILEAKKVAAMAEVYDVAIAPHNAARVLSVA